MRSPLPAYQCNANVLFVYINVALFIFLMISHWWHCFLNFYSAFPFVLADNGQIYTVIVQKGFDPQWLSITFSKAIFLGNGLVAIVAGLFANFLADNMGFGPVAPFDAAACFLAIGMAIILSSWGENYGDSSDSKDLITQFKGAAKAIASGRFYLS